MSKVVGARLREMRLRSGVSLAQVAEVLALEEGEVAEIESGERHLSVFEMGVLSQTHGWTARELLGMGPALDAGRRQIEAGPGGKDEVLAGMNPA